MSKKPFILPAGHDFDMMYLVVNGVEQGLISQGASSSESLGSHYKRGHGHEDAISVSGFSYGGSNPINTASGIYNGQSHSDAFGITKMMDKSSPLLQNAVGKEALSSVELKCFRTSFSGRPEHYFTVHLKHARVVVIDTYMNIGQDGPMENIYFSYHQISIVHERCGTIHKSNWQHSTSLHAQRNYICPEANEFNGLNVMNASVEKRRLFFEKYPTYSAYKMAQFWMVVSVPFAGVALAKTSYGATMWAFRNPVLVTDVVADFTGSYLPGSPALSKAGGAGVISSFIYGYEKW
ncbi:MAG: hypothetical protein COA44_04960 [Arcobacter sp.]|nr:MAG: hypothetical protein COA44_04960 [Arcobacter sp.]